MVLTVVPSTANYADIEDQQLVSSTYSYITDSTLTETGEHTSCDWWSLCIASDHTYYYTLDQKFTTITTNSLKADNPIDINFIGSDSGSVTVASQASVVVDGAINSRGGSVSICAGVASCGATAQVDSSISTGSKDDVIAAQSVALQASGSVGSVVNPGDTSALDTPVNVSLLTSLTPAHALPNATNVHALLATAADGNVSIDVGGDALVEKITAAGDPTTGTGIVDLEAGGSIVAANLAHPIASGDTSALIQGQRVILDADNGEIGSLGTSQALRVNTGYVAGGSDREFGDPATDPTLVTDPYFGLSASAAGNIDISSAVWSGNADGTILVDQVLSRGGDVLLTSPGQVLDNEPVETIDSRTYAQLLDYWNSLDLLAGADNTAKQQLTVTAYENSQTQSYDQYWRMRQSQSDGGATFNPDLLQIAVGTPAYNALYAQFKSDALAATPSLSPTDLATAISNDFANYLAAEKTQYAQLNTAVGSFTTTFDKTFNYKNTLTPDQLTTLTNTLDDGAVWTTRELAFSLSPGALKTITATNPVIKAPNVSGLTVTIDAGLGVGETVGANTANVGVEIPVDLDPSALTDAQKIALATAERSDLQPAGRPRRAALRHQRRSRSHPGPAGRVQRRSRATPTSISRSAITRAACPPKTRPCSGRRPTG